MSIFGKIKNAIFGPKEEPAKAVTAAPAKPIAPSPSGEVNVEQQLDGMPGSQNLNWRSSIVDLMKLVGLDAGYDERKELAAELDRADYSGSADDNIWLHRAVMNALVKNGGRVPDSLL